MNLSNIILYSILIATVCLVIALIYHSRKTAIGFLECMKSYEECMVTGLDHQLCGIHERQCKIAVLQGVKDP